MVLNLFLWSAYQANKNRDAPTGDPKNYESNQIVGYWDWFIKTFINPYDTIAQWAMALLSLAAIYLLWETLKAGRQTLEATRVMANDARELGRQQILAANTATDAAIATLKIEKDSVRPFILCSIAESNIGRVYMAGGKPYVRIRVEGVGKSVATVIGGDFEINIGAINYTPHFIDLKSASDDENPRVILDEYGPTGILRTGLRLIAPGQGFDVWLEDLSEIMSYSDINMIANAEARDCLKRHRDALNWKSGTFTPSAFIWVSGRVRYKDNGGTDYETMFSFKCNVRVGEITAEPKERNYQR